jgi:hypothetical protein
MFNSLVFDFHRSGWNGNCEAVDVNDSRAIMRARLSAASSTSQVRGVSSMKTRVVIALTNSLLLLGNANVAQATVTFSDGTFNDSDWQVSMLFQSGNGGSITGTQVASGGNPGAYRRIVDAVNGPSPSYTQVLGFHQRLGATYDASIQGPISTLDFSIDFLNIDVFGAGHAYEVALSQDGELYAPFRHETDRISGWRHDTSIGLTANDFFQVLPAGLNLNQHPDFSATASPIAFGFYTANSTTDVAYTITVGYDNWNVAIHPVPVPGTATLATMACICVIAALMQKSGRCCLRSAHRRLC